MATIIFDKQQLYWQYEVFSPNPDTIGFHGNAGIVLPSGTTFDRPATPLDGHIRLNTSINQLEAYWNGSWHTIEATGPGVGSWISLGDTPNSYAGSAGLIPVVNQTEDGIEYAPIGITAGGDLDMGGQRILGLPTSPTSPDEAVSKAYVDANSSGLDPKESVRVATVTPGVLATDFENGDTIDGVVLATGDRILIKDQVSQEQNGIYIVQASGAPVRAPDQDGSPSSEASGGNFTFVEQGAVNIGTGWVVVADGEVDVGVDPMIWTQFSGAGGGTFVSTAGDTMTGDLVMGVAGAQFLGNLGDSESDPSFSWDGDEDTGIFSSGTNEIGFTTNGAERWVIDALGNFIPSTGTQDIGSLASPVDNIHSNTFLAGNGSAAQPSITFGGDTNTGLFSSGADSIGFSSNGVLEAEVSPGQFEVNNTFIASGLTYPTVDGAPNTFMTTDGAGNLSFVTINLWSTFTSDSGSTTANAAADTLTVSGGAGISTAIVGDTLTITNDSPNVDQNIWATVNADAGGTTANNTADTLTVSGGAGITTAIVGDTLTITNTSPGSNQFLWETFNADAGSATANTTTDVFGILGGTGISTAIVGDNLTITNDSPNVTQNLWATIQSDSGSTIANVPLDTLTVSGGTGISTAIVGDTLTITNDKNVWTTFTSDSGSTSADNTTDNLTVSGGSGISTAIVGDTLTITNNRNIWATFNADSGTASANTTSDSFTLTGGTGISTAIVGDTITITNDKNVWTTFTGDSGSTSADNTTDNLTVSGGTGISTAIVGDTLTITNDSPNVVQNLWETIVADSGSAVANVPTDTLTVTGGVGISTAFSGDTLTITNSSPNVDQNVWATIQSDSGSTVANTTTDTLTIAGGVGISTSIVGDTLTIDGALANEITDLDGDTKIEVEKTADDDTIRFSTGETPSGYGAVVDILTIASSGFNLDMGTPNTADTSGAPVSILTGDGVGTGVGGDFTVVSGNGGATSANGGSVNLTAGDGGGAEGDGGFINLTAGNGGSAGIGGEINIASGDSGTGESGGVINLSAGLGDTFGGNVNITAGDGSGASSTGGSVILTSGLRTGAGVRGAVYITDSGTEGGEIRWVDSDQSDYVGLKAPATVPSSFTLTLPTADASVAGAALVSDAAGNLSFTSDPVAQCYTANNITTNITETFTHNLNSTDVMVQVHDLTVSPPLFFWPTVEVTNANQITVTLGGAPSATDEYKVIVLGTKC